MVPVRAAVACAWWLAVGVSGHAYGELVRVSAKCRVGDAETEWTDVAFASSPRFREASTALLRGVPLPAAAAGGGSAGDGGGAALRLRFGPRDDSPAGAWVAPRDGAGAKLRRIDATLVHDGARVVDVEVAPVYGPAEAEEAAPRPDDAPDARFAPTVRVRYAWRWRATSDAGRARALVLASALVAAAALLYVTLRDSDFDDVARRPRPSPPREPPRVLFFFFATGDRARAPQADYDDDDAAAGSDASDDDDAASSASDSPPRAARPTLHRRTAPRHRAPAFDSDDDGPPPARARTH